MIEFSSTLYNEGAEPERISVICDLLVHFAKVQLGIYRGQNEWGGGTKLCCLTSILICGC